MEENLDNVKKETVSLSTPMSEITDRIMEETNIDTLKDMIDIFNLNLQKKNIIRSSKLYDIQDLITNQMETRVKNHPDEFNNQDLLTYFKVVQETIAKSDNSLDSINTPAIKVTQNQLNINVNNSGLDRDSRERIMDAVNKILKKANKNNIVEISSEEVIIDDVNDNQDV